MEKNKDYWNKGLPYLDGIEFYNLIPFSPELGAAILSNRVDYARIVDPVTARKAKATPGMSTTAFNQSVIQGTWTNDRKKPFDDPRVRRAFHLAMDRHVLVDVVKDVAPMQVGGFIYPFSEFATPKPELFKRVGYQEDPTAAIKEAKALMAAAGYANGIKGLDFMVRDIATFKLWAQAIQAMLQQGINVQCNLRTVVESVWFDDAASGHFDLCVGAIVSTLLDPSDYFNAWYRTGGPQNYSFWDNPKFNALVDQIDAEVDPAKRKALVRQAEAIMEQDPPVLPNVQGPRLHGARCRHLQTLGAGHPGDAAAGHQCGVQPAHGGGIGMVRRCRERAFRSLRSAPSSRRCWIRRTTSTPGTAPAGRRTIRSGTTRSSMPWWIRSTTSSMPAKRKALIRQAEEIMEQDPPVLPICWEQINDVWWNYVKGYNPYDYFGIYDVVREDIFWLDKA